MKNIRQKRLAFLDETVKHFNSTNRGIDRGMCKYSEGCAIGRKIPVELALEMDEWDASCEAGAALDSNFKKLPIELRKLGRKFLGRVQMLHDAANNWNESGLSIKGVDVYEQIKRNFNLYEENV